jgi:hypothetical protein
MREESWKLVETDARPVKGCEIKCRHSYPPLRSDNHGIAEGGHRIRLPKTDLGWEILTFKGVF